MNPLFENWLACPTCGGDLVDHDGGVRCVSCGIVFARHARWLDMVDPTQRVSSEGPGDTLAMAWRRRRWDELRGPSAPENAAYLAAIWERLRPDDRVLDLGCGPATFLRWIADFAPELAIMGLDLSAAALEEAERTVGDRANVGLVRASARRRLPVRDGSCDVILRRLAPGLPEEIVRALAPGGHYLRFTFGPGHWREVYDLMPGLPRAREETLAGEVERLRALGLEVDEPIRHTGEEQLTLPAVMLALRSNPAAYHANRLDFRLMRTLWHEEAGGRRERARLSTEYMILTARKPAAEAAPAKPKRTRRKVAAERPSELEQAEAPAVTEERPTPEEVAVPTEPTPAEAAVPTTEPIPTVTTAEPLAPAALEEVAAVVEAPTPAEPPKRRGRAAGVAEAKPEEAPEAAIEPTEPPKRRRRATTPVETVSEPASELPQAPTPKRARRKKPAEEAE